MSQAYYYYYYYYYSVVLVLVVVVLPYIRMNCKSSPVTGLEWPRGFQEIKVPRFHDNGTGWW
jgi:hypothetical protein